MGSKPTRRVRTKIAGELGKTWPELAQIILNYYISRARDRGLCSVHFQVRDLPISVNHMYGRSGARIWLKPEAENYRLMVLEALGTKRWSWKPSGVTAAVLLLESPKWITKRLEVREMDADNRVKPIFDAIEVATETPDELHWQFHVFKIASKWTRTSVYLFDLGDVVEWYS